MSMINLQCPVDEWYLARIYLKLAQDIEEKDLVLLKNENQKKISLPIYFLTGTFLLMIFIAVLSNNIETINKYNSHLLIIFILSFATGITWLYREFKGFKTESLVNHPEPDKEVTLYSITKEGILINYFNADQYTLFLPFEGIQYVAVRKMAMEPLTEEGLGKKDIEKMLNKKFKEVQKIIPDFRFEKRIEHDDIYSISIKTKENDNIILPIPPTWETSKLSDKFIGFIRKEVEEGFTDDEKENRSLLDRFMN